MAHAGELVKRPRAIPRQRVSESLTRYLLRKLLCRDP